MTQRLADKLYRELRKHRNISTLEKLQQFMNNVAENSYDMHTMYDEDELQPIVAYRLNDNTTMTFSTVNSDGKPWVKIQMLSGIKAGRRTVFVENVYLSQINIPDVA
jgi:pyridoxine/pyridoxamine 5'-phosphate oxidase